MPIKNSLMTVLGDLPQVLVENPKSTKCIRICNAISTIQEKYTVNFTAANTKPLNK